LDCYGFRQEIETLNAERDRVFISAWIVQCLKQSPKGS
jgi:hypothetical protein